MVRLTQCAWRQEKQGLLVEGANLLNRLQSFDRQGTELQALCGTVMQDLGRAREESARLVNDALANIRGQLALQIRDGFEVIKARFDTEREITDVALQGQAQPQEQRFKEIMTRFDTERKISDEAFGAVNSRLDAIEGRLAAVEGRLAAVEGRFDGIATGAARARPLSRRGAPAAGPRAKRPRRGGPRGG